MPKQERDIGMEILEGIRQIKRGEYGNVTVISSATEAPATQKHLVDTATKTQASARRKPSRS